MQKRFGSGRILFVAIVAVLVAVGFTVSAPAADQKPIKIGIVSFLSGPAAGPFGVPARNGAEILVEALNEGGKVPGYGTKGLGGTPIEVVYLDEAGGTTKQVTEYRNLVQRQNVDLVIGYISSGDTLAIAPVAEELKKLTVFFDSGTPRIFEDASYKYVFRTGSHSTMDSVGAALYVTEMKPNIKKYSGINQNYAWGQDSWSDFDAAMKILAPKAKVGTSQMTKLMSGQFGAEISVLLASNSDVIHSSFWGGDTESFVLQAAPRGLFKKSTVVLTCGEHIMYRLGNKIPDGTVIGGKGTVGVFAPDTELNRWFQKVYAERYDVPPTYPTYRMAQAVLGVKAAYEKAMAANKGATPTQDQVIASFEHLTFDTPSGKVEMGLGKGHQAVTGISYGTTKVVKGKLTVTNIKTYPKEKVNPPDGVMSKDWIESGFKRTK